MSLVFTSSCCRCLLPTPCTLSLELMYICALSIHCALSTDTWICVLSRLRPSLEAEKTLRPCSRTSNKLNYNPPLLYKWPGMMVHPINLTRLRSAYELV